MVEGIVGRCGNEICCGRPGTWGIYIFSRSQDYFLPLGGYFEKLKELSLISAWQPGPATLLCWSLGASGGTYSSALGSSV